MIATYRDTEVGADHPLVALVRAVARRAHVLPVTGLDADAVASLMVSTAGTAVKPELTRAVCRQTGGNPFFVGEITRLLDANGALDRTEVSVGVPAGVREVIERRMARFPQRCIELLTLGAVVGEEFHSGRVSSPAWPRSGTTPGRTGTRARGRRCWPPRPWTSPAGSTTPRRWPPPSSPYTTCHPHGRARAAAA